MARHRYFQVIRNWFSVNLFGQTYLNIVRESARPDVRKWYVTCWLKQNDTAVHTTILVHAELNGNLAAESDGSTAAGSQPAPVPALLDSRFSSVHTVWSADMCPILSTAADRCSKEPDAYMDRNDVTCAVSIIQMVCFKIQEAALKTDCKEVEQWRVIKNVRVL